MTDGAKLHEQRMQMIREKHEQLIKHMEELQPLRVVKPEEAIGRGGEAAKLKRKRDGDRMLAAIGAVVDGREGDARRLLGATPPPPPPPRAIRMLNEVLKHMLETPRGVVFK